MGIRYGEPCPMTRKEAVGYAMLRQMGVASLPRPCDRSEIGPYLFCADVCGLGTSSHWSHPTRQFIDDDTP